MPWRKSEPMEERIEFGLKALRSENFRALCREYGITARTGYKWRERFLRCGIAGMGEVIFLRKRGQGFSSLFQLLGRMKVFSNSSGDW